MRGYQEVDDSCSNKFDVSFEHLEAVDLDTEDVGRAVSTMPLIF